MNITVEEWNEAVTVTLIPNIFILSVYLVLGIFGNVIVIAVYKFQMKETVEERYFIPILAAFDLLTTLYCASYGIVQSVKHVNFSNKLLCQCAQFFIGLTTFIPILLLLIIAVQRYIKVCKPLKPQMSLSLKRGLLFLTLIISFLVALPIPFVYGTVQYKNTKYGITGMRCGKLKKGHKLTRAAYGSVIGLFALTIVTVLIVLYSKIGYTVYKQFKKNKSMGKCQKEQNQRQSDLDTYNIEESSSSSNGETQMTSTDGFEMNTDISANMDGQCNTNEQNSKMASTIGVELKTENSAYIDRHCHTDESSDKVDSKETTLRFSSSKVRIRKTNRRITHKLTIMFLVITVVFLLSYFPKVILLLLEGIYPDFWERLSNSQRPGVMFIYHMYIINNIVNPFIYAFMDLKFRNESKIFLKRLCTCMH